MERDVIHIQRGEPYTRTLVFRESADGVTWTRQSLTGCEYAQDIRADQAETSTLLLSIRSDDTAHYAVIEGTSLQLPDETTASSDGVIVITVPKAVILTLPPVTCAHDWALIQSGGDPRYKGGGPAVVEGRITVVEEPTP
jgi:hypothetical protein